MEEVKNTVGSLNPAHATIISDSATIMQCVKLMVQKNTDCLLAVDSEGSLSGIVTDKDIAYKVVADGLDPNVTRVISIMTRDPIAVYADGSRNEALNIMVGLRFRHLPVIYEQENYIALLDITKLIFDRLDELEKQMKKNISVMTTIELLERTGAVDQRDANEIRKQNIVPDLAYVLQQVSAHSTTGDSASAKSTESIVQCAKTMRAARVAGVIIGNPNANYGS